MLAASAAFFVAEPGMARKPHPAGRADFVFSRAQTTTSDPVEQESPDYFSGDRTHPETWVHNPTPCIWDVDEFQVDEALGDLAAGATVTDSLCLVADQYDTFGGDDHNVETSVTSPKDTLLVTVAGSDGTFRTVTPVENGRGFTYYLCFRGPRFPTYPVVDGSNGGTGVRVDYTVTVQNPTGRTIRDVAGLFHVGGTDFAVSC